MIGFVNGEIEDIQGDMLLVDCGFMGYNIFVTSKVALQGSIGDEVKLYTHMSVREDGISLFGFLDKEELCIFRMLIGVNGVGPKSALSVLANLAPEELAYAVIREDAKAIGRAQGIGPKTAQRIIMELKDKIDKERLPITDESEGGKNQCGKAELGLISDAIDVLVALGYTESQSQKAVKSCDLSLCTDVQDVVKLALKII